MKLSALVRFDFDFPGLTIAEANANSDGDIGGAVLDAVLEAVGTDGGMGSYDFQSTTLESVSYSDD